MRSVCCTTILSRQLSTRNVFLTTELLRSFTEVKPEVHRGVRQN